MYDNWNFQCSFARLYYTLKVPRGIEDAGGDKTGEHGGWRSGSCGERRVPRGVRRGEGEKGVGEDLKVEWGVE